MLEAWRILGKSENAINKVWVQTDPGRGISPAYHVLERAKTAWSNNPCHTFLPGNPLQTRWWRHVHVWQTRQIQRHYDIVDTRAAVYFRKKMEEYDDDVRSALRATWKARNPKFDAYWERRRVFRVEFK